MQAALDLTHPFELSTSLEIDAKFAFDACAHLGPDAITWRYSVFEAIHSFARALAPLDDWASGTDPHAMVKDGHLCSQQPSSTC